MKEHLGKEPPDKMKVPWPLMGDGTLGCISCHNVHADSATGDVKRSKLARALHERAVEKDWRELAGADVVWPGTPAEHSPMLRADLLDGGLCQGCHGAGGAP